MAYVSADGFVDERQLHEWIDHAVRCGGSIEGSNMTI
jgi:hypothetical protein